LRIKAGQSIRITSADIFSDMDSYPFQGDSSCNFPYLKFLSSRNFPDDRCHAMTLGEAGAVIRDGGLFPKKRWMGF
jgi:hypothetical protein